MLYKQKNKGESLALDSIFLSDPALRLKKFSPLVYTVVMRSFVYLKLILTDKRQRLTFNNLGILCRIQIKKFFANLSPIYVQFWAYFYSNFQQINATF